MKRSRISPVNRKRRKKLHARNFGPKRDWVITLPCCVCGRNDGSDPAHVRARGMGGCGGSSADLVPLCRYHHGLQHSLGIKTFQDRFRVNLRSIADHIESVWLAFGP